MTKDSKTVTTIRRRKGKQVALALQKIKENPKPAIASDEEIAAAEVEDKCYLFDDQVLGPITLRRLMSNDGSLFLALLAVRCANALLIQTQYVPDEYWQSLEVSHNMVFGYGYITWEWREGLRGYTYPLVFALFYKILYLFGLDSRFMLIKVPRLVQGAIAAWGDLHLYKLSSKLSGRATGQWTLLCQVLSWFMIYCSTRTLSNSTETSLVVAALSYFPWPDVSSKPKDVCKFLTFAALSVVVRPTAALVWLLLGSWHLQSVYKSPAFTGVVKDYLLVGSISLGASAVVDRVWYGHWTFVQLSFLMFNVVQGGASSYGVHPWHWYFSQGFPVVIGSFILPFCVGAWRAKNKTLLWILLWILVTHSFLPHKEFRFIMPTVPLAMHFCGIYFQSLCIKSSFKLFKPKKKVEMKFVSDAENEIKSDAEMDKDVSAKSAMNLESPDLFGTALLEVADLQNVDQRHESKGKGNSVLQADAKVKLKKEKVNPDVLVSDQKDANQPEKLWELSSVEEKTVDSSKKTDQEKLSAELREACNLSPEKKEQLKESDAQIEPSPEITVDSMWALRGQNHKQNLHKAKVFIAMLAVTNLLPALYFCLIHQRGTVMVTKYLYDTSNEQPNTDALFLMPCHSTPYYSYIHNNISMRFLTCEPNLHGVSNYTDEADIFYENPKKWLIEEYGKSKRPWPSHIVYFNTLHPNISSTLVQNGYKLCEEFFHTHIPDGRVGTSVFVSCR